MDTKEKVGQNAPPQRRKSPQKTAKRRPAGPRDPKREMNETSRPLQDVVYVPPKPFVRNRLLLGLATVAAVVLALVLAMAVFFRVDHIQVSGMEQYESWEIKEASGIKENSSLFSLNLLSAAAKVQALDYVKDVRISIRLPNMVQIEITEVKVTYALQDQNNAWWLVESGGKIVEKAQPGTEEERTQIFGIRLLNPEKGKTAVAVEEEPETDENGNPIPVTVTGAHRLSVALDVATYLEANNVLGNAANIDVSDLGNIRFQYGEQYKVKLGNESDLLVKISNAKAYIDALNKESHNKGTIDASYADRDDCIYDPDI